MRRRLAAVLIILAGLAGWSYAGVTAEATTQPRSGVTVSDCPPHQPVPTCFRGRVIIWDPRDLNATGLIIEDGNGAPMAWVNLYGLYSGGDGGKEPGGLICVTYGVVASVACLTPRGDLILTPTGPGGPSGPPQVLTPRDIRWIHAHGG